MAGGGSEASGLTTVHHSWSTSRLNTRLRDNLTVSTPQPQRQGLVVPKVHTMASHQGRRAAGGEGNTAVPRPTSTIVRAVVVRGPQASWDRQLPSPVGDSRVGTNGHRRLPLIRNASASPGDSEAAGPRLRQPCIVMCTRPSMVNRGGVVVGGTAIGGRRLGCG